VQLARTPLKAGIVGSGEVRDPGGLATTLNELFTTHHLPRRGIRLGLANTRIGVRIINVGGVSDLPQLENAISFRAHEILSVPLDEAVFDYHILSTSTGDDEAASYRILLVVAYKDSVERYLAATDAAGIEVAGIDLDAFALLRALPPRQDGAGSEESDGEGIGVQGRTAVAAVSVDHDLTTLAITDGTTCQVTRVLEWGSTNVDVALCRALKVTAEQAVELRRDLSLEHVSNTHSPSPGVTPEPADVVRRELQTLLRELVSSIRFYGSQEGVPPVRSLAFSGWLVDVPGLVARLGTDLGVTVTAADPFGRVETSHEFEQLEGSAGVLVAVGLGIED
jgi:type IV pilus assembly protein PilM